jgi:hypothetical protein
MRRPFTLARTLSLGRRTIISQAEYFASIRCETRAWCYLPRFVRGLSRDQLDFSGHGGVTYLDSAPTITQRSVGLSQRPRVLSMCRLITMEE